MECVIVDRKQLTGNLLLLTTAVIWGSAFVAQRVGMDFVGPLTFSFSRFILAVLVLIPVVYFMDQSAKKQALESGAEKKELTPEERKRQKKMLMIASLVCGCVLFAASIFQQIGLVSTSAGKTGFITAPLHRLVRCSVWF